jgi:phage tail-like protein
MAATQIATPAGVLWRLLPAIYQEQPGSLALILAAHEAILLGGAGHSIGGRAAIEESIARLHTYLDPRQTRPEFLPWLAGWLALTLRADLDVAKQAELVARIIPIYQWWGTRKGLEDLLELLTDGRPSIVEPDAVALEVGRAIVGSTTRLGHERPHFFQVRLELPGSPDAAALRRMEALAREVIDLVKPAHTHYSLDVVAHAPEQRAERAAPSTRRKRH